LKNIATTLFEDGSGFRHPVALVTNCRSLTVTQEEYDLILKNRSKKQGARQKRRLDHLAAQIAADILQGKS